MTGPPDDLPDPERGDDLSAERGGVDVEAAWAQIVAHWSDEAVGHAQPGSPLRVSDSGEDRLLDITDVTHPARTGRSSDASDGTDPTEPIDPDALGAARPAAAPDRDAGDDPTDPLDGDEPLGYSDYPTRHLPHRLTPEEVAELAEEGWASDASLPTDDRRSTHDWRRPPSSPSTSHVGGEEARSGRSASLDDDGSEGFVPPDPPPMPTGDIVSRIAWAGALGAPLFLLAAALFWRDAPSMLIGAAVAAFVAGFVALIVRMPDRSDDEDDGAVV